MRKPLFVYSSSNFYHGVDQQPPDLRSILVEVCGKRVRRIDRFTQLALIGCFQCKSSYMLPQTTGLYLSSIYGSVNNAFSVLSEIYQGGQLPRPVEFVNTVGNAACFHIAEQLQLLANSQFIACDTFALEAGLKLASIDLEVGNVDAALVGVVCEAGKDLSVHRQRIQIDPSFSLAEGSHWLYLAHHLDNEKAIAEVTSVIAPISDRELQECLSSVIRDDKASIKFGFGNTVPIKQRKRLLKKFGGQEVTFVPRTLRHEFYTALNVCGFLESRKHGSDLSQFIHIDTDGENHWSVIALRKCA